MVTITPIIHDDNENQDSNGQEETQSMAPATTRASLSSFLERESESTESSLKSVLKDPPLTFETKLQSTSSSTSINNNINSSKDERHSRRRGIWSIGTFVMGTVSISAILLLHNHATTYHHQHRRCQSPGSSSSAAATSDQKQSTCHDGGGGGFLRSSFPWAAHLHSSAGGNKILEYLDLFRWSNHSTAATNPSPYQHASLNHVYNDSYQDNSDQDNRHLVSLVDPSHFPQLVVAGKMTVEGGPCNIAQFNLKTEEWSLTERIQLSLYNSYSGGEVYSLLANHTFLPQTNSEDESDEASKRSTPRQFEGSGELIVVGAFDTTYRNSQVTYCSVGEWNGKQLSKVGEGLCNSALSKGMKITTTALAGPYDVFVAGSFQTQVWNGDRHEFVKIFNIAHFNAVEQVWLPLDIGQITCSWCTVTVLALAWDSKRRQLHVTGKFNAIDGRNVPAGLAIYDVDSGRLVAHPGGGLTMTNQTQDGVGTALQLDEERGVLYVMGSFERLTLTGQICLGLAAFEIKMKRWTCLADTAHTVLPTGGGNMLLTQHGLMVAGRTAPSTTWPDPSRPYTIALLKATLKTAKKKSKRKTTSDDDSYVIAEEHTQYHDFNWSWLPGFYGHDEPLHALSNGFADYEGTVYIAGDNLVAKWSYELSRDSETSSRSSNSNRRISSTTSSTSQPMYVPVTEVLSSDSVRGSIMAISQMMPEPLNDGRNNPGGKNSYNVTIIVYGVAVGCVIGMFGAILCNRNLVFPFFGRNSHLKGISLDTLTYSALENSSIMEAYQRAMKVRYVEHPHLLTIIDPQEIFLQRIIGEGTFGRVWSARWSTASVAVKEFVFAQAAVAGKSSMQQEIVEEIIGEAGMMAILRHPNVLQLFGCSLTAQAIWIVSELCSLGSLRQVLDGDDRSLPVELRLNMALQVAEGMAYLHNQDPPIIHRDLKSHNIFVHETFTDAPAQTQGGEKRGGFGSWRKKGKGGGESIAQQTATQANQHSDAGKPEKMKTNFTLVAKIGDWGSARATLSGSRTMTHGVGTACWLAPEVIKHARSSKYSDVYGYGIILWELATREEVYQGLETTQIIAKVANESLRPPIPQDCPWKDIMVKCWAENPLDRLEFGEIVQALSLVAKKLADAKEERARDELEKPDEEKG